MVYPPFDIATVVKYDPNAMVATLDCTTFRVRVFPLVVADSQLTLVVAWMVGLVVEVVLSLPTTVTIWAAGTDPLKTNVVEAGFAKSTGVPTPVTSNDTVTGTVPLGVVTFTVAV